ncbi:MAG: hypothetical protein ACYTF9_06545 [Planctomycetota bacterium]
MTAVVKAYVAALQTGTRDELEAFCRLPVTRVTDDDVALCERFPFDPVRWREATGVVRSNLMIDVVHVDERKAHVLVDGTCCRADGSVAEHLGAIYVLHRLAGEWKIRLLTEIRGAPDGA